MGKKREQLTRASKEGKISKKQKLSVMKEKKTSKARNQFQNSIKSCQHYYKIANFIKISIYDMQFTVIHTIIQAHITPSTQQYASGQKSSNTIFILSSSQINFPQVKHSHHNCYITTRRFNQSTIHKTRCKNQQAIIKRTVTPLCWYCI